MDITSLRQEYTQRGLRREDLNADPLEELKQWMQATIDAKLLEPNAASLATATKDGIPSVRTILIKSLSADGIDFFTNSESRKGREISENPHVALVIPWIPLERQVIIQGTVSKLSEAITETYAHKRPRQSQLSTWASQQSRPIPSREPLEEGLKAAETRFKDGPIPVPPYWAGYRITPTWVEFWQGRPSRLHDRFVYQRNSPNEAWSLQRLSP